VFEGAYAVNDNLYSPETQGERATHAVQVHQKTRSGLPTSDN